VEANARISAYQTDILGSIRLIKAYAAEDETARRMDKHLADFETAERRGARVGATTNVLSALVKTLAATLYSWSAWRLMVRSELSMGEFVAFSAYLGYLAAPATQLTGSLGGINRLAPSLRRFFDTMDATTESAPNDVSEIRSVDTSTSSARQPEVEFRCVSFGYDHAAILNDVNLSINRGSFVAIVGKSGAGKSTLIRLLLRMYSPSAGQVLLRGRPINKLSLRDLRRDIAVVLQDGHTVPGTLRENLTLGGAVISDARLEELCGQLGLSHLTANNGLERQHSEWTTSLSAGERQRISVVRALARDCHVLVFDEATANLDWIVEQKVLDLLQKRVGNTTVIVATHRLSSVKLADCVYMVDEHRVWGGVSHNVMLRSPNYAALWRDQEPAEADDVQRLAQVG
jgi:ABC-type multidrug transport system fused ATPase/permease subunit